MTPTLKPRFIKPRFIKALRERAHPDGSTDRYWVVIDKALNDFQVLKVNTTYPGSESLAQVYAAELNRLGKKEVNDDSGS